MDNISQWLVHFLGGPPQGNIPPAAPLAANVRRQIVPPIDTSQDQADRTQPAKLAMEMALRQKLTGPAPSHDATRQGDALAQLYAPMVDRLRSQR